MSQIVFYPLLFAFLLFFSAFVSCAETAFFSLSRVELYRIRQAADWPSRRLRALLRHPRETLVAILIGNEVTNVAISVVAADFFLLIIPSEWQATLVSIAVVTPLILIVGEILPKNLAVYMAPQIAPALALPIELFATLIRPLRALLIRVADVAVRCFGGDPAQVRAMIVEEEFRHLVDMSQKSGAISPSEGELIHRVFDFGDTSVEEIMTPARSMFRLPIQSTFEGLIEAIRETNYSRIPVYADSPDDVVGVLYARDVLTAHAQRQRGLTRELEEIVRPVLFVQRTTRVEEALKEFQLKKIHIAIVLGASGKPAGIVTMDDILGSLFGKGAR
ncbi:MAG: HlyC/CorC family transporter [Deltaproteobacteria bacterium]|nr:HlyC/CorC family transporter [Deltaproteobacteria bacterium]